MLDLLLRLDRLILALICAGVFCFLAAMVHYGAEEFTSLEAHAVYAALETLIVAPFGREGGAIFLALLGLIAGAAVLMWQGRD
jgi:hypothetical protein